VLGDEILTRLPSQPPRSPNLLPGLRLGTALNLRNLGLPIAFLALFAFMPLIMFSSDPEMMLSLRSTETAPGRVERTDRGQGCGGSSVRITYSFSTGDGLNFRGQDSVCAKTAYAEASEGQSIPITYVKSEPTVNRIAGFKPDDGAYLVFLFPVFGLVFFLPLIWPSYSRLLGDRKLFKHGILARGRVAFVTKEQSSWWPGMAAPARAKVYVQVRLPSGSEHEFQTACTNDWLLSHLPPGADVLVACDAKNPQAALLQNYLR
jgi:hypothetical protein